MTATNPVGTLTPERKLRLALAIVGGGFVLAGVYHLIQKLVFDHGYPYSTFLFKAAARYSDFSSVMDATIDLDPYVHQQVYYPFTYVLFYPLAGLRMRIALALFFGGCLLALGTWVWARLRGVVASGWAWAGGFVLVFLAYPVLFCVDRGNVEFGLLILLLGFLSAYERGWFWMAIACLVPAICLKVYPVVFLGLLVRRGQWPHLIVALAASLILSVASLALFSRPMVENLRLMKQDTQVYADLQLNSDGGMSSSASLWSPVRLALIGGERLLGRPGASGLKSSGAAPPTMSVSARINAAGLTLYSLFMVGLAAYVAFHVACVETEFWRRAALLLIFMVVSAPAGADYKMIHLIPALCGLITLKSCRSRDLLVIVALALVLVPKKYIFIPGVVTDSGYADASLLGIVLNPLLMLAVAAMLCADGWRDASARGRVSWTAFRQSIIPPAVLAG